MKNLQEIKSRLELVASEATSVIEYDDCFVRIGMHVWKEIYDDGGDLTLYQSDDLKWVKEVDHGVRSIFRVKPLQQLKLDL